MQKIIFVRHAKALDRAKAEKLKVADKDRPLTQKGIAEFQKHVLKYKKTFKDTELFVTSPYLRATETLDVLLETMNIQEAPIKIINKIRPEDTFEFLKKWLINRKEKKIVVVSHEPFISYFLQNVVESQKTTKKDVVKIKKGAIISIEYELNKSRFKLKSLKNP